MSKTTRKTPARKTPAQTIAETMVPNMPPDLGDALCDADTSHAFEQIRDDVRGRSYDDFYAQVSTLEKQIQNRLPEADRPMVARVSDLYGAEEQASMEAAYLVGVEVGKRMAGLNTRG